MQNEKSKMQIETESCPGAPSDHFHLSICPLNFAFFNIKEEPCPPMKRDAC